VAVCALRFVQHTHTHSTYAIAPFAGRQLVGVVMQSTWVRKIRRYRFMVKRTLLCTVESGAMRESPARRNFCRICGSALWAWDPRWPELIHPFASAIDTDLPVPPQHTHLMVGSKASWVELGQGGNDKGFDGYPDESIAEWHSRLGLDYQDA